MADLGLLKAHFKNFESTLKETSLDDKNGEYLCSSNDIVYGFDRYIKTLYSQKQPKSFDALLFPHTYANLIVFIEFKNQILSEINMSEIREKYESSFLELQRLFEEKKLSMRDYCFEFFLVCRNSNSGMAVSRARFTDDKERELKKWAEDHKNEIIRKSMPHIKRVQECRVYHRDFFDSSSSCDSFA